MAKTPQFIQVTQGNWRTARDIAQAQLIRYLRSGYRTAADVAQQMGCSFMVARRRIRTLREGASWVFDTKKVRQGGRGPEADAFKIVDVRASKRAIAAKKATTKKAIKNGKKVSRKK